MIVSIDKSAGFCWGVVRTVEIAEAEMETDDRALYSLGEIIHNPQEIERLEVMGLRTISHDDLPRLRGERVLIRAHGEPPETYQRARDLGVQLIDATCPVVWKVQERIRKFYDEGYQVVVFGKKDHAEVNGLVGQTHGEAVVIRSVEEIDRVDLGRKTVLFSQTTMDKPTFYKIRDEMARRIKEFVVATFETEAVDFHAKDTICGQVSGRDKKLREFSIQNEIMIFVAGRHSSNGKVLFSICKEANPRTYFIEHPDEIQPSWFEGVETVGISGATSTPHWLMERIQHLVETMSLRTATV